MARFHLKAVDGENGALIGGIEWGPHKYIIRTLMDLGYVSSVICLARN